MRSPKVLGLGGLTRRQLVHDVGPASVLALMVLLVAAIFTAAPAAMSTIATAEIRHTVDTVSPNDRDLTLRGSSIPPEGPATPGLSSDLPADAASLWGGFAADLAAIRDSFPPAVKAATGPARFALQTDAIPLSSLASDNAVMQVSMNADPYLSQHLRLTTGRWPAPPKTATGTETVEVVLASASAKRMGWALNTVRKVPTAEVEVTLRLVGTVDANPADPDYPKIRPSATQPAIFDDGDSPIRVTGFVYVATGVWKDVSDLGPLTTVVWFPTITDAFDDGNLVGIAADIRRVTVVEYPLGGPGADTTVLNGAELQVLRLVSELPASLDAARNRVVSASAVQTVAALGPCGAALAVLSLGVQAFLRRRQPAVALMITRGAAIGQVRRSLAVQGLVIGLPTAVIAVLLAQLAFGWTVPRWAMTIGLLAGLIPAVALPLGVSAQRLRTVRADLGGRSPQRARRVGEVLILALAGLSLYLLLSGGLTAGTGGGADVLVAAAPIFLTLAVCVLVIRLYPWPLRAFQRLMRRRRGAVGFLGAVRSLRDPLVGIPLILATVTGVAVSVFSVVTLSTVNSGIDDSGIRTVGADLSVTGAFMTPDVVTAARKVPGVAEVTSIGFAGTITVKSAAGSEGLPAYFVDSSTFSVVQADIPGAPAVPTSMAVVGAKSGTSSGSSPGPSPGSSSGGTAQGGTRQPAAIQVVVPDSVRARWSGPVTSDGGIPLELVGGGQLPAGFGDQEKWLLVDVSSAGRLVNTGTIASKMLLAERPGADESAIDTALAQIVGSNAVLLRPEQATAQLRAAPTIGGMRAALIAATVLGVLLVAMAVVVTAVSGTGARNRLLSVLRLLGLNHRQVTQLASWEQAPPALTAVLVGGGFGVGLTVLIRGVVDLRAFTGGTSPPAMSVQPWGMVAVIGGFLLVIAVAIGVSAVLARRASAAVLMRTEE